MKRLIPFLDRIIAAGNEPDANGCWNWQDTLTKPSPSNPHAGGYGKFYVRHINGKTISRYAHNLSYMLLVVIPAMGKTADHFTDAEIVQAMNRLKKGKKEGSHTCHNRRCVNPLHQNRETHSQNMSRSKTRIHKLSDDDVREIRQTWIPGKGRTKIGNTRILAKKFGVTRTHLAAVARGREKRQVSS